MAERAPKRCLRDNELEAMRERCSSSRDAAVFEVLRVTGCREHEMLAVRFQDVDLENKTIYFKKTKASVVWGYELRNGERVKKYKKSVIKPRHSLLDNQAVAALRIYMADRAKEDGKDFQPTHRLFKMTDKTVRNLIKSLAVRAKIPDGKFISPHWLRHTCGTKMLSAGMEVPDIKKIMGWSPKSKTFETTYDHTDIDMLQKKFERTMEKPEPKEKDSEEE